MQRVKADIIFAYRQT